MKKLYFILVLFITSLCFTGVVHAQTHSGSLTAPTLWPLYSDGTNLTLDSGHLILPKENDAVTPTLTIGGDGQGFYSDATNRIKLAINGLTSITFKAGTLIMGAAGSAVLIDETTSATNPVIIPNGETDLDTGMGAAGADELSLIAGGVEILRLTETASGTETVTVQADIIPHADNTYAVGTSTVNRFADVYSVRVNGADIGLENKWVIMEAEDFGYPQGIAITNDTDWRTSEIVGASKPGTGMRVYPKGSKPVFAITKEFIEFNGVRISNARWEAFAGQKRSSMAWFYMAVIFGLIGGIGYFARRQK